MSVRRCLSTVVCLILTVGFSPAFAKHKTGSPANAPAQVEWNAEKGKLSLRYHGTVILDAAIRAEDADGHKIQGVVKLEPTETLGDKVEQRLKFVPAKLGKGVELILRGTVLGSEEAFPAETFSEAQIRFPYVRNSVGLSRNLRNNTVYDRRWDWVLIGPADGKTHIKPKLKKKERITFSWESRGSDLEIIFRPRFYQKHKNLPYFEPWTYKIWEGPLTGYCTWWAYRGGFTQKTLDAMLELFVEKHLPDFGYDYMQFDDTYQQGNGSCPENWLNWDKRKFPGGWKYSIKAIRDAGMKPGIWVHRVHRPSDPHVADIAKEHPDWFVHKPDGSLFTHHGFYVLNTTNEEAVENMVRKLYSGLKEQGWDYVKIDGTGDLLRAYQNKECDEFFEKHPTTPEQSLRKWDIVAREELGSDVYILACHTVGNARHVIGLVNGARLSNDGFQPRTLAQYNFMEGVVWRNDPDHCDVLGEWLMDTDAEMAVFATDAPVPARTIIRPAICAMAGGVLMLSDKVEVYWDDRNIEGIKRSAPILFTVPGQLYSCECRPVPWWLQEIDRPFEHWLVLARIQWGQKEKDRYVYHFQGAPQQEVKFADLGLPADREYLVFEFWDQKFLGRFKDSFTAGAMDENTGMDVFAIREARSHPWVISTTRHISQGGVSLIEERWDRVRNVLSGTSSVVIGDPYVLTVHLPEGFRLKGVRIRGENVEFANQKETATVRIIPSKTKTVEWRMTFANRGNRSDAEFPSKKVTKPSATPVDATSVTSTGKCDYISWVDPRIETARGRWFFSTPAARPFGMAKLSPHTVNRGQGGGGYNCAVHTALGFCHLHGWMTTGLEVMPTTGGDFSVTDGEAGWKSAFDPKTEIVKPGYHKLFLEKYAMWVELTTTQRVGMHRYTYTKAGQADIVINLGGPAGPMKMKNGHITRVSDTQIEGYYDRTNGTWGGPAAVRIFFVMQFEKPFEKFTTYDDPKHNSTSAFVTYDNVSAGDVVQMKAALSFTSIANARANMAAELDHWDFDAVRDESLGIWNTWLGRIDVEGGTDAQRTKFYTDLWHVLLGRHVLSDVDGAYPDYTNGKGGNGPLKVRQLPLGADGKPKFNMYNSDAYWLTQWNINLVWGLAWPRMLDEFCNASLQMARDGGKLPRGPCGGGYTHIMTACPATMMIVGAYMKGCCTFDPEEAFAIIKDNHSVGGSNMLGADPFYVKNGWKPGRAGRTVEMCFQDWCAAQMAGKLGKTADYAEFMRRSAGWKKLFHPPTGLLLPRNADGRFSHTNPLSGRGWVEANAWQASWFTSHDVQGLANLMGGRDEYCRRLNFAFEKEADHDFVHGYGAGYVSYANQPGCQNAHLFNYAGKPWLTQYWVRRVNEQAYGGTTPQLGYGGHDEDQGQMGGVSSLMSMGLFSVRGTCAVEPIYEITTPVFDKITIALDDKYYSGGKFVISTKNNTVANTYIQSARLDGRTLNNAWFYHSELADGGTLELVLGPQPNFNWGIANLPPSESPPSLTVRRPDGTIQNQKDSR